MKDIRRTGVTIARTVATAALGRDPGPLAAADSMSHHVYIGFDIVVKIIDAAGHSRLDREIALASRLPGGLAAPLLDSGLHEVAGQEIRYACYARVPGSTPGMGLPGADAGTARSLAEQAVQRLHTLHSWVPTGDAERTLREPLDHGGFVGREALLAETAALAPALPAEVIDGLTAIAESAPTGAGVAVPVHADCHWGNWLVSYGRVTALLDFEWARFGEPDDDWFFVIADSGPHLEVALGVIARETGTSPDLLRARCELREAAYLASDVRLGLSRPGGPGPMFAQRLSRLEEVASRRAWWGRTAQMR